MFNRTSFNSTVSRPLVLAEFSLVRVIILFLVAAGFFIFALDDSPPNIRGVLLKYQYEYPAVRTALIFIVGLILIFSALTLGRVLFVSRRAVYVSNQQLCWAWALGTMRLDINKISSLELKFPATIVVHRVDGGRVYLPSALTRTASTELLSALEKEVKRPTTDEPC